MIPIVSRGFALVGLDALARYGVLDSITYRLICMFVIITALTFCNWVIGKMGVKFIVGK